MTSHDATPTPASASAGAKPADDCPLCNILIVDDEPSNLLALEAILEPLGQRIVRANSGIEALRHALKMEFCVVLLDVQMPEMDGLEAATLLRKRPRTRDVPIIFLTAINKDDSWVARGYEAGAVDYLFKPYDPDALRTKVATFVELGRKNALMRQQHEALRAGAERELAELKKWSERRYEDLADSMPQIVWTADASGAVDYHNRRWSEIASAEHRLEDGDTTDFGAIAHPGDRASFTAGWKSAVRAGKEWEAELRLGSPARGYRFHLVRAVPRRDESGKIVAWIGTATDIDARVRADRALRMLADASHRLNGSLDGPRELEAVLRMALPILGDGAILDVQGGDGAAGGERIRVAGDDVDAARLADPRFDLGPATVGYSGRAEVFLDVARESDTARPRLDGFAPAAAPHDAGYPAAEGEAHPSGRGSEHLRFLRELGASAYICVPLISRDRTIGTLSFVRFEKGEHFEEADVELAGDLARRIAVAIDNARLHATTERRREELEQVNRSKDVFLATLSHELRTPLNAIVGWTDMMKNGVIAGDELQRAMETIDRNAHALSGLVADLLDVSRIVTGTLKLDSRPLSLVSVVESAVLAARPACNTKGITLDFTAEEGVGNVLGDSGRLRQVIANLLSNAIKFTPHGGKVRVRVEGADGRVRIVVSDTGEGISPEFLPHVFERFRQAETGRAKGLGLGLAIVKHLIEEHGGTVSASSEGPGKGATFTVELPLAVGSTLGLDDAEAASLPPTGEPDLTGVHVLVVEDDPDGNELVCTILERYGARVTSATTAGDALELLQTSEERPHVLVSDIGLPDMDGMELIRKVREVEAIAAIPAVALTAYASRQDASKAIAAGFDAHVAKPVQPATIGGAVVRLLAKGGAAVPEPGSTADPPAETAPRPKRPHSSSTAA